MTAFEGDDPAVGQRQGEMMLDLSGQEGVAAGFRGGVRRENLRRTDCRIRGSRFRGQYGRRRRYR